MDQPFERMLRGGHPNSLGRTAEVVDVVLAKPERLDELLACYRSADPVVRLRASNALKRVEAANRTLLIPHIDRLIGDVGALVQPSAQWTLAQLFARLADDMDDPQRRAALHLMMRNLAVSGDWIVLAQTMATLTDWAGHDAELRAWLIPHLQRLATDPRKSVAGRAVRSLRALGGTEPF